MPEPSDAVITRFAPSPTGHLHVGGARTAMFCRAFARRSGGRFMIRIEDTDQARSSHESARGILEDLAWLGLTWDDGPAHTDPVLGPIAAHARDVGSYFQSDRLHLYRRYTRRLVERGHAYPAFESADELEARRRDAAARKQTYRYDRAALRAIPTPAARLEAMDAADREGRPYVVRFVAPDAEVVVHDEVLGDVRYAAGEMDDFVIRKADGFPTYHFAVVIDDELMGVTHVLRAQEHLNNTPRHVAMQRVLVRDAEDATPAQPAGTPFRTPVYAHMPLIFNMDGTKMGKRDKAKAARAALQDRAAKDPDLLDRAAAGAGLDAAELRAFLHAENDSLDVAEGLARWLDIALPEIQVNDFRENGYLPEAITNFLALLGWSPGVKTADGKDLEKFDLAFLDAHFSIERIGKTNARFDRKKLLSFNADAIAALSDADFARRWRHWLAHDRPGAMGSDPAAGALSRALADDRRGAWLARAVKPRAKTLRDAWLACRGCFAPAPWSFDPVPQPARGAVEKTLRASDGAGLRMLAALHAALAAIGEARWTPEVIHAAYEAVARDAGFVTEKGPNIGPVAQPARVALTGSTVTPPLGEIMAVIGRAESLARVGACLAFARA